MSKENVSIKLLRKIVLDGLLLAILIAAIPVVANIWQPFQRGFFCGDESIMYPFRHDTVQVYMLRLISYGIPLVIFLICEWILLRRQHSTTRCFGVPIPSWTQGFYCVALSFVIGTCFTELVTNIAKNVIGRPRPCFLAVCQPSVNCSAPQWQNRYIEPFEFHCTGSQTDMYSEVRKSFLSGHTSLSTYAMTFLILYLEKRMTWQATRIFRHVLQFCAGLVGFYIALSRVSDYRHHWSDVLAGYVLGVSVAVLMCHYGTDLVSTKNEHTPLPQTDITLANHQRTTNIVKQTT